MEFVKCPNCGANCNQKNQKNCEYCGSLFIRFINSDIPLDEYFSNEQNFKGFIFPRLEDELIKNILLQDKNDTVVTDVGSGESILQVVSSEMIGVYLNSSTNEKGVAIQLTFPEEGSIHHEGKFLALKESKLFAKYTFDGIPCYIIDFGKDAKGAAALTSKLLIEVYGITENTALDLDTWAEKQTNKNCFIATATYESNTAPEVIYFRKWRNEVLFKTLQGRLFIKIYYLISPYFAKLIYKNNILKVITKYILDKFIKIINKDKSI